MRADEPVLREATAQELEYIRLCVLRRAKAIFRAPQYVELANIDQRRRVFGGGTVDEKMKSL